MAFPWQTHLARAFALVGDSGVTLYPVPAASVQAWLAAGNTGTDLSDADGNPLGVVEFRPIQTEGEASVDIEEIVYATDSLTVDTFGIDRDESSIGYDGVLYDVIRVLVNDPEGRDCHLRRHYGY